MAKIIIDISESDKKIIDRIKDNSFIPTPSVDAILNAVRSSTPLPKGHGRLIDVNDIPIDCDYYDVDTAPTIIEADREVEE